MDDPSSDAEGQRAANASPSPDPRWQRAQALVDGLVAGYREQIRRALGVTLDDTETSLAFVDHHLKLARDERRGPILALVAAGAGAYYGELVRRTAGAIWIGDGDDPRALRLLLRPQFIYVSPVDQALEAIVGESLEPDDPRVPPGPEFDPAFHLEPVAPDQAEDPHHDAVWLQTQLDELSGVPEDQFHSLTCRFETLTLMLELLASKHAHEGRNPSNRGVEQYLEVLRPLH